VPDLTAVAEVLAPGTRIGNFFASPEVPPAAKREALRRAFEGKGLRTILVFVDLLLRKQRLRELREVARHFEALVERARGIAHAQVVSAVPLTVKELERLTAELERTTMKTLRITTEVDASLLGGVVVRIGDRVMDRSVRTLLQRLGHHLRETRIP